MIEMTFEVVALVGDGYGVIRSELVVGALKRVDGLYLMMRKVAVGGEVMGDVLVVSVLLECVLG
jgi:hypothetical protein